MTRTMRCFALLLCFALILPFAACGGSDTPRNEPTTPAVSDTAAPGTDAASESPSEPQTEPETAPAYAFTAFSPEDGSEHILIPDDLYAWYAPYTTKDAYYSSMNVTEKLDNAFSVPVTLTWAGEGTAAGFTLRYGLTPDLSGADTVTVETEKKKADIDCLFTASVYYWQVTAHTADGDVAGAIHSFRTAETVRLMHIEGLDNARDIGGRMTSFGVRMKQGICYRSAEMNLLGRRAQDKLKADYGIVTDLDLRNAEEATSGQSDVPGLRYIHAPGQYYRDALKHADALCAELRPFADPDNYPMIFHCGVGRDRTGTVALLIEALCGMSEVDIVRDYEETYLRTKQNKKVPNETADVNLNQVFLPFLDYIRTAYGEGSLAVQTERCLLSIGMTAEELTAIRRNLLDDAWVPTAVDTEWKLPTFKRAPDSDEPVVVFDAAGLIRAYQTNSGSHVQSAELSEDGAYATFTIEKDGEMTMYLVNVPSRLASVLLVRYRTSSAARVYMETFIDSVNQGPVAHNSSHKYLTCDGAWHTVLFDLEGAIPEYNGYYCQFCRLDMLNNARAGDSVDISFAGFFTGAEAAERYAQTLD